jgi:tetratricopeptide (TPR) repeat protein
LEKSFENTGDELESIKRFEQMMENNCPEYLEVAIYLNVISHYQQERKFDQAQKACELGLELHPFSLELKLLYSTVLLESGQFEISLKVIEEILTIQPTDIEYLSVKAELFLFLDRNQEALDLYLHILPLSDDKAHTYYQLSEAAQGIGNHELAITYLLKTLRLNPNNEDAMFELYHSYDVLNKLDECIIQLNKFIDENPYSKHTWYNLGILYDRKEDYEKAIDCYEFAVAIDEDYSSAFFNMGSACMVLKDFEKAVIQFKYALEIEDHKDPYLLQSIGHCYFELDNYSLALKNYHKGIKIEPLLHESWYGVGLILEEQEKWLEAVHFFSKAHEIDELLPKYIKALAQTEYQLGNIVSSLEYFEKAISIDRNDINIWISWSFVYHEQGDNEHAIQIILDALEDLPDEAELFYRLACYLITKGNLKEAFIYLENALILNYELHTVLFEFFQDLETQKALVKIIDQYRKN